MRETLFRGTLDDFRIQLSILSIIAALIAFTAPAMALEDGWYKATSSIGTCSEMVTRGVSIAIEMGRPLIMKYVHVKLTFLDPEKLDKKEKQFDLREDTGELRQAILKAKSNTAFTMSIMQNSSNGRCGGTDLVFELNN
ncbi:MAG: hypothetical protein WCO61_02370 [Alphaproteobacteria bacterium]